MLYMERIPGEQDVHFWLERWDRWRKDGLKETLLRDLSPETLQKVVLSICFVAHRTRRDFEILTQPVKETDVFIPECFGWTRDELTGLRGVSLGIKSLSFWKKFFLKGGFPLEIIYGLRRPIVFIDVPESTLAWQLQHAYLSFSNPEDLKADPESFGEVLERLRKSLQIIATADRIREAYMCSRFGKVLKDELYLLENKKRINVLLLLGAAHLNVAEVFERSGLKVERIIDSDRTLRFTDDAIENLKLGQQADQELLAKVFFEKLFLAVFGDRLLNLASRSYGISRFLREIASRFGFEEIESVFRCYSSNPGEVKALLTEELAQKGMRLPRTRRELA